MINAIEIKNFKMFEELSIKRLAPVTLVGGMNNVGKSSLLEGVFVAASKCHPNSFPAIFGKRLITQVHNSAEGMWQPFFREFDYGNKMAFSLHFPGDKEEQIEISYRTVNDGLRFAFKDGKFVETKNGFPTENRILDIKVTLKQRGAKPVIRKTASIMSGNVNVVQGENPGYETHGISIIIGSGCTTSADIAVHVGEIDKKNAIQELVEFVKMVEPSLNDISVGQNGSENVAFLDCGFPKKINASLSGEGTLRLLSMASLLLSEEPEILLIDEVENGLHYSVQPKFWEALSTLCREKNVQIIAATHSRECIEAAVKGMKANNLENDFAFVRLQRNKKDADKISAVEMTAEDVSDMSELEWEIR